MYRRGGFYLKILIFPKSRAGKNTRKMPLLRNRGAERRVYENRAKHSGRQVKLTYMIIDNVEYEVID